MRTRMPAILPAVVAAVFVFVIGAGCTGSPSAAPTAPPTATPGGAFTLRVLPEQSTGFALPGEKFVFLVDVSGTAADGSVTLAATSAGAAVSVEPATLSPGAVAEVTVVPNEVTGDEVPVVVEFSAARGGQTVDASRTITVQPGTDELQPEADLHLAPFAAWLAENRPELNIGPDTEWEAVPGTWVLIVSHYLYFSEEWELDLDWHVMVAPDDWSRICLRKRWTEMSPSLAFEISSFSTQTAPHEIDPPESVWR
jgi:hypothetical protein